MGRPSCAGVRHGLPGRRALLVSDLRQCRNGMLPVTVGLDSDRQSGIVSICDRTPARLNPRRGGGWGSEDSPDSAGLGEGGQLVRTAPAALLVQAARREVAPIHFPIFSGSGGGPATNSDEGESNVEGGVVEDDHTGEGSVLLCLESRGRGGFYRLDERAGRSGQVDGGGGSSSSGRAR